MYNKAFQRTAFCAAAESIDEDRNRVFVDPFEVDGTTGRPTGRALTRGQWIFGINPEVNQYWAAGVVSVGEDRYVELAALDRDTLTVRHAERLDTALALTPTFALDPIRGQIYVGYMTRNILEIYLQGPQP